MNGRLIGTTHAARLGAPAGPAPAQNGARLVAGGAWETWDPAGGRGSAAVTIAKSGMLILSRPADHLLGRPDAVELLHDRAGGRIGIRKVAPGSARAVKVSRPAKAGNPTIPSARRFLAHHRVAIATRRLPARLEGDVLVASLREGEVVP